MKMKMVNPLKVLATPTSRRQRGMLCAVAFLAFIVVVNLDVSIQSTKEFLRSSYSDVHSADEQYPSQTYRYLSKNLGGGKCEWLAPEPLPRNPINTTTLLASYPGGGKRLAWRILEALTGSVAGDDWDLSRNGYDTLTIKTSYPHNDGVWKWTDKMDQVILLVRNPRWAIPAYHTMRYELDFSTSWLKSFSRTGFVYTERPGVRQWNRWRNGNWYRELNRWSGYIDFWMTGGMHRNTTENGPEYDHHCKNNFRMDCNPVAVIQFENLYSEDVKVGVNEALKVASALDGLDNVYVIEEEARPCVYKEVMARPEFYNKNRDKKEITAEMKEFHYTQLELMKVRLEQMVDKYSADKWLDHPHAVTLVNILNEYLNEVSTEYEEASQTYYDTYGFVH